MTPRSGHCIGYVSGLTAVNETQHNSDRDIPQTDFSLSEKSKWGAAGEVNMMTFLHTEGPSLLLACCPDISIPSFHLKVQDGYSVNRREK